MKTTKNSNYTKTSGFNKVINIGYVFGVISFALFVVIMIIRAV